MFMEGIFKKMDKKINVNLLMLILTLKWPGGF